MEFNWLQTLTSEISRNARKNSSYCLGTPQLTGTVPCVVYVTDINDETPTYDSSDYVIQINENLPIGDVIKVLTATDNDEEGNVNKEIRYSWVFFVGAFQRTNLLQWVFLVGAFLVKRARPLQGLDFFVRPQTSSCMYHFLVQTLLGLRWTQRSRVRVLALARNFFEHLRKRTRLKGPLFQFFSALCDFFSNFLPSKGPTFKFFLYLAAN